MIIDAIRTWLITAPGWMLLAILALAALMVMCLVTCTGLLAFAVRVERIDVHVQRQEVDAELAAMTSPQDAPEGADGRELT